MPAKKDPKLARAGVSGYNKPKRTPNHPTKKFVVVAKQGNQTKTIRFGDAKMTIKKESARTAQVVQGTSQMRHQSTQQTHCTVLVVQEMVRR